MPKSSGAQQSAIVVYPLYVCLQEHREQIVRSLTALELEAPLLSVGPGSAMLDGPVPAGLERFSSSDPRLGLPPARIRLDRESPLEEFMSVLLQRVVAAAVQGESHVEFDEVAREIFQAHWVHLSVQGRRDVISRLKSAAAQLGRGELRGFIRIEGSSSVPHRVVIVDSPASADPRGAPQEVAGIDAQGCTRPREGGPQHRRTSAADVDRRPRDRGGGDGRTRPRLDWRGRCERY